MEGNACAPSVVNPHLFSSLEKLTNITRSVAQITQPFLVI
jgi:hypothetical protein